MTITIPIWVIEVLKHCLIAAGALVLIVLLALSVLCIHVLRALFPGDGRR